MVCECHLASDPLILHIWSCLHHYNYRDARFAAERVFAENPCEESLYLLATCLYRNNLPKQAKLLLLKHDLTTPKCKYLLAKCHADSGNFTEAELALVSVNQDLKNISDLLLFYKDIAPYVLMLLADIFKMTDRRKLAVMYLKKCLELNPFLWSAYQDLIDLRENIDPNEVFTLPKSGIIPLDNTVSCLKALNNRINIGEIPHPHCPPTKKRFEIHDSQEDLSVSLENVNPKLTQKSFEMMDTDEMSYNDHTGSNTSHEDYHRSHTYQLRSPSRLQDLDPTDLQNYYHNHLQPHHHNHSHHNHNHSSSSSSSNFYQDPTNNSLQQTRQKIFAAPRPAATKIHEEEISVGGSSGGFSGSLISGRFLSNSQHKKPLFGNINLPLEHFYGLPLMHSTGRILDFNSNCAQNTTACPVSLSNSTKKLRAFNTTITTFNSSNCYPDYVPTDPSNSNSSSSSGTTNSTLSHKTHYKSLHGLSTSTTSTVPSNSRRNNEQITGHNNTTSNSNIKCDNMSTSPPTNTNSSSRVLLPTVDGVTLNHSPYIIYHKITPTSSPPPTAALSTSASSSNQHNPSPSSSPTSSSQSNAPNTLATLPNAPRTRLQVAKATAAQQKNKLNFKNCFIKSYNTEDGGPTKHEADSLVISSAPLVPNQSDGTTPTSSSASPVEANLLEGDNNTSSSNNSNTRITSAMNFLQLTIQLAKCYKLLKYYKCRQLIQQVKQLPRNHSDTALVNFWLAKAYNELNDRVTAHDILIQSRCREPWQLHGVVLLSSILWRQSKESSLLALANEIVEFDRDQADIWCVYGNCMSLARDCDNAVRFFQRAIQIDPRYSYGYILLGHEYFYDNELELAQSCFRRAMDLDPTDYSASYGLAMICQQQDNYCEANKLLSDALHINPESSFLLTNAAVVKAKVRLYSSASDGLTTAECISISGALELLDRACQLYPREPLCRFHKASILFQMGKYQEALTDLKQLVSLSPKEAKVYLLMSLIYKQMGDLGLSMMYSSRATELNPKCNNDCLLLGRTFCQLSAAVASPTTQSQDAGSISSNNPIASTNSTTDLSHSIRHFNGTLSGLGTGGNNSFLSFAVQPQTQQHRLSHNNSTIIALPAAVSSSLSPPPPPSIPTGRLSNISNNNNNNTNGITSSIINNQQEPLASIAIADDELDDDIDDDVEEDDDEDEEIIGAEANTTVEDEFGINNSLQTEFDYFE